MTRPLGVRPTPRMHLLQPSHWPYGDTDGAVEALYAQGFCQRLHDAIGPRSMREAARRSGVSHGTIGNILRGDTWPDLITAARLEWGLASILWPGPDLLVDELRRHRRSRPPLLPIRTTRAGRSGWAS